MVLAVVVKPLWLQIGQMFPGLLFLSKNID